jgi:hypothetical protein
MGNHVATRFDTRENLSCRETAELADLADSSRHEGSLEINADISKQPCHNQLGSSSLPINQPIFIGR